MPNQSRIVVKFNRIPELKRAAPQAADKALGALAFEGERDVKQSFGTSPSAPGEPPGVDTGTLRNSIHVEKPKLLVRRIADGVNYGIMLEYGTRKMAARPFMGPMAERIGKRAPEFFQDFLK